MIISPSTSNYSDRIPLGKLGFVRGKLRNDFHVMVLNAFAASGLTQSQLAKRLGKAPAVVNRCLGGPANWTIDTAADLLFAIKGSYFGLSEIEPTLAVAHNIIGPEWLIGVGVTARQGQISTSKNVVAPHVTANQKTWTGSQFVKLTPVGIPANG